jgi:hypothetical protein
MTNEIGSMTRGTKSVAIVTAILGALIAALSLYYFFSSAAISGGVIDKDRAAAAKEIFDDVVIKTLVPIFNTLIAAILAWVFGKPLVASLAERLRPSKTCLWKLFSWFPNTFNATYAFDHNVIEDNKQLQFGVEPF